MFQTDCPECYRSHPGAPLGVECESVHECDYDCERGDGCTARPESVCVTLSCAEHMGNAYVVREVPMADYVRLVAAPSRHSRRERFHLSGRPAPLRGQRLA